MEAPQITKARRDGFYFVLLGCAIFFLVGTALETAAPVTTVDFRVVYYSARCLLDHRDPYNPTELDTTYRTQGGETPQDNPQIRRSERMYNYLPTAFPITLPFALVPFGTARWLWLAFTAGSLILASFSMWDIAARSAPLLAGVLVGLSLVNSELFLILGNPAGIAIAFCVIAVWCISENRFVFAGLVCFALSLMLKPHDGGLIWLYFLISGASNRKRALQILGLVFLLSLPGILWLSHVAPAWPHELQSILATYSSHGDVNDPGPSSMASHGIGMVICLQAVISLFRDDPRFYNPITYLICGTLLAIWLIKVTRSPRNSTVSWLALAPIAALSMLPVYHRIYDARLLLLAIPACAILWKAGGAKAWLALSLSCLALVITGGIPWAVFLALLRHGRLPAISASPMLSTLLRVVPVPLTLLLAGTFFLWAFVRGASSALDKTITKTSGALETESTAN
jgi:hypothetical protein